MSPAIWWLRRDLRLHDNEALHAALAHAGEVIPLWIADPALLHSPYAGRRRLAFLREGLQLLNQELRARGSRLIIRSGPPVEVLEQLQAETGATGIFAGADYSPYARRRDRLAESRLPVHWVEETAIQPPGAVLKADGGPYQVFSAFRRRWLSLPLPRSSDVLPPPAQMKTPHGLDGESFAALLPGSDEPNPQFPAGEAEALRRLGSFVQDGLTDYAARRNVLDEQGTSCLSPYLRFGMLSPRQAAAATAGSGGQGASAWLHELIWRDFFIHVLYHFPSVTQQSFRPQYRSLSWRRDEEDLAAWQEGRTGYPLVDAAMRQLRATGWLHNRARMVAASFLAKDLLLDWREGERWFRQQLIDGDVAANNGNWQWVAGTGTDAVPYFRLFNPVSQGKKYDPTGAYVRRWLPELASVPLKYVHEPWKMPDVVQQAAGCLIGADYPPPLVDHAVARTRALAFFRRLDEPGMDV